MMTDMCMSTVQICYLHVIVMVKKSADKVNFSSTKLNHADRIVKNCLTVCKLPTRMISIGKWINGSSKEA